MTRDAMDPARIRAVDELFDAVLDQPTEHRDAWLAAHCSDSSLRREVRALLEAHERRGILDMNIAALAGSVVRPAAVDRQIGPYRVLRELGRGGMGVVYLAERADGHYRQRVAVKLLRASPDAEELHQRFLAERQILASLSHPNIAQLLDGGVTDGQLPYLVMEYVDGHPITTYCDRRQLGIEERLRLFLDVCAAVHHAHQNLILHRDIKPGNILVTDDGRVKLLDFGIAKLLNPSLGGVDQPLTRTEFRVLTPEYASPEQMRGESLTTTSDVYALGVVLYELLTGRRPHPAAGGGHDAARAIAQRDPDRPSSAVGRAAAPTGGEDAPDTGAQAAIAGARGLSVERLRRRLQGDLDAIVMMALRPEPSRRYGSADLLREDVQRHLDGLTVLADRGSRWYQTRKFLRRRRVEATAAVVVLLSLMAGTTIAIRQARAAQRERDRAEQALGQSKEVAEFLVGLFRATPPAGVPRDEVRAKDLLASGTERVEALANQPLAQAQMLDALGRVHEQLGQFDQAERMLQHALTIRRGQLGANHPDVAATLVNLATVVRQRARGEEAAVMLREALAIQQRTLGPQHPEVAATLKSLAVVSDPALADTLYRRARSIQQLAFGPGSQQVINTNVALASQWAQLGNFDASEALYRETLAMSERLSGPEHPNTAIVMMHLGGLLLDHRDAPVEAESLYTHAARVFRKQTDQWLPHLVGALSGLTGTAAARGDYVQAERYAREAYDARVRAWGPDHPYISETMAVIADQLIGQRRLTDADRMLADAQALLERTLGPEHDRVARMMFTRARVHAMQGQYARAESELRRALSLAERTDAPRSRWVGAMDAILAEVLTHRRANAEADSLFERSAAILRPLPPRGETDLRAAYLALADHYRAVGRPDDDGFFRRMAGVRY